MRYLLYLNIFFILFSTSCTKEETPDPSTDLKLVQIAEKKTSTGVTVTLWAENKDFSVAYNKVYVKLKDASGANLSSATVSYRPVMDMTTMSHSSPVEQPVYEPEIGYYKGAVVFSMQSGSMGSWILNITVNNESLAFEVVVQPALANTKFTGTFMGTDGKSYSVSLIQPSEPKIGLNLLEVLINKRQDMMNFPPVEDLTVEVTPEMPSMSHGSPNNVNPVHSRAGHYVGKLNFTMTGDWRLHFRLRRGDVIIVEDAALDLLF